MKVLNIGFVTVCVLGILHLVTSCEKKQVPVLSTVEITDITGTTATSGGNITDEGSGTVISRGVCWGTGFEPTVSDNKTVDGAGAGSYTSHLTDLSGATKYFVRSYATNSAGTGYGMALSFTTLGQAPVASTNPATNITTETAVLHGTVNSSYLSTVVSFEYGESTSYGNNATATPSPITGNINTNINASLNSLLPNKTYHFRVKAVNTLGTTYGNDMTFVTLGQMPTCVTKDATNISSTASVLNGSANGNLLPTSVSFEYGIDVNYGNSIAAIPTSVTGNTMTNVNANLTGLTSGTTYHFRIKAVNVLGTVYGNDAVLVTDPVDYDGNSYNTVTVGNQVWTVENLQTTKFNDGSNISLIPDASEWAAITTSGFCYYGNDLSNKSVYGGLYNWFAVNSNKLCPLGWHVPSDAEWSSLTNNLGGVSTAGGKLKEAGNSHWLTPNTGATNSSGFTGLPGGVRYEDGSFFSLNTGGGWWSSTSESLTKQWYRGLYYGDIKVWVDSYVKNVGFSVRCLKD